MKKGKGCCYLIVYLSLNYFVVLWHSMNNCGGVNRKKSYKICENTVKIPQFILSFTFPKAVHRADVCWVNSGPHALCFTRHYQLYAEL